LSSRRNLHIVVLAGLIMGVLAACGSSNSSTTAATSVTGTSGGSATPASAGNPIVVGGVADAAGNPGIAQGFAARVAEANRAGGIDGRQIKFLGVSDDGQSPSQDTTVVQNLVLKDQVFAVAPVASDWFQPASSTLLQQHDTPYVGYGTNPGFCGTPWGIPINGCLINTKYLNGSLVDPMIKASGQPGSALKVAIIGQNNAASQAGLVLFKTLFAARGTSVVFDQAEIPTAANIDYSPYVQALMSAKPNLTVIDCSFSCAVGLSAALKGAGYSGLLYNLVTYLPDGLSSQPSVAAAIDGSYIESQFPVQESGSPATEHIKTDLAAANEGTAIQFGTDVGYWSADVLIAALKATAAKGPLTPTALEQTIASGFNYRPALAGSIGPETFPADLEQPVPCATVVKATGTSYQQVVPFACYSIIPA
jgi:ABC-type branched-subunit amino acid transport system substrate-binding protein